ncbi:hypothetical protein C0J08_22145 [Marinomonas sp. CT5]|nr:hypothetical protein C0J08_22145 [Marinomonas sp. CT5]
MLTPQEGYFLFLLWIRRYKKSDHMVLQHVSNRYKLAKKGNNLLCRNVAIGFRKQDFYMPIGEVGRIYIIG